MAKEERRVDIAARVIKLRAFAADNRAQSNEREAAESLAARLIQKHDLTEDELRAAVDPAIIAIEIKPPSPSAWIITLAGMFGAHYTCEPMRGVLAGEPAWLEALTGYTARELAGLEFVTQILFIGDEADAQLCSSQYEAVLNEMQRRIGYVLWHEVQERPVVRHGRAGFILDKNVPVVGSRAWVAYEESWADGVIHAINRRMETAKHCKENKRRESTALLSGWDVENALTVQDTSLTVQAKQERIRDYVINTVVPALQGKVDGEGDEGESRGTTAPPGEPAAGTAPPRLRVEHIEEMFERGFTWGRALKIGETTW